jgi:histidinol-phosphatase (PHP family)
MRDYHVHTFLCRHASGTVEEYVEAAIGRGIEEICFTDHMPMPEERYTYNRMLMEEIDIYFHDIEAARTKYPGITILTGIEAEYIKGYEDYLADWLGRYPFDMVIMSIHYVAHWPEGQWVFGYHFPHKTIRQIYHEYFQAMVSGIRSGLFDVVGHLDLIKRNDIPVLETNGDDIERVLEAVHQQGMCVEANTSGLRKSIGEIFPSLDIIPAILDRGIPLTLGSDAHKPEHVGFRFTEVSDSLKSFTDVKLARFKNRQYSIVPPF